MVRTTKEHGAVGIATLFLRSLLFLLGMGVSTIFWAPVILLCWPLPLQRRYRVAQQWSRFNIWWLKQTCHIDYHISGLEHLSGERAAIVLAKHQSTWETLFLQQLLPLHASVLKRELLRIPFFGWAMASLEPIAIERKAVSAALRQILRQGKNHLDAGTWIVLFPEGTRTLPGKHGRYGISGAKLAAHSGYPIIPIAHNAGEFWPRHGFLKRPGTIQVVIGPPISSQNRRAQELNALTEAWIESTMERISNVSLRSNDAAEPPATLLNQGGMDMIDKYHCDARRPPREQA